MSIDQRSVCADQTYFVRIHRSLTYAAASTRLQEAPRSAFGVFWERVVLQKFGVGAQSQYLREVNDNLPVLETTALVVVPVTE